MANNTTLDTGAGGDVIATDDVAGVKYQRVKLVDGTEDATGAIGGDATNGLDVDVTRLPGTSTGAYATVSIGTTQAAIKAANAGRRSIAVQNVHATNVLYVGFDASVTTSNGIRLSAGESLEIGDYYTGAVHGIASAASTDVRYMEVG